MTDAPPPASPPAPVPKDEEEPTLKLPLFTTENLLSRETLKIHGGRLARRGSVVFVNAPKPIEAVNRDFAKKVIQNVLDDKIAYTYVFESDQIDSIGSMIALLMEEIVSKAAGTKRFKEYVNEFTERVKIYFVCNYPPFAFCVHNALSPDDAECYMRHQNLWVQWYDASKFALELRRIAKGDVPQPVRIFHDTENCHIHRERTGNSPLSRDTLDELGIELLRFLESSLPDSIRETDKRHIVRCCFGFPEIEDKPKGDTPVSENYVDFDLHIAPDGHAVSSSIEGQATARISLDIPSGIELTLSLIEARQANAKIIKQVGQAFYDWLFPSPIHTHFHQTEAVARSENSKIRLRLRIEAEEIASLPLEFLYRKTGGYFMAINPATVLSRYLNLPLPPERVRRREGPLHMLAIIADPTDQTPLPPDDWEAIIKDALAEPLANEQMTLQTVKRATHREIGSALLQQKPDIIQFVGHGIYQNGKGYLALVDDQTNKTWLVDDESFADLYLGYDDHLGLISLATCESAQSDNPQGFLGIAPKLVQRGLPTVLAMQYAVLIETAKIFLEYFYSAVAARKPIDWSAQSARNAVSVELGRDNREFATPVLYMRAQDGNVF